MKTCKRCGVDKPKDGFYKHPMMADGRLNICKECKKAEAIKNRNSKIEYYREYDRKRANLPHRVQARKEYASSERGREVYNRLSRKYAHSPHGRKKRKEINEIYQQNHPKRYKAKKITGYAIRIGGLVKEPCEICGSVEVHAHHDDYNKPLTVRWLCPQHHRDWHKENTPIE